MTKQKTLKNKFSLKGTGFHLGLEVNITFCPAPENFGYKICRTDLSDQPMITATATNVVPTNYGIILSENGIQVSNAEHSLAALYACNIDNCLIKVDAPVFPILDGNSAIFINKILHAGIKEQSKDRIYYAPDHTIEYQDKLSGSHLILLPSDKLEIHSQICFDSEILNIQSAVMHDISEFSSKFAPCRTFVFIQEIKTLLQKNMIKMGDLGNTIIIYDKPIKQKEFDKLTKIMNIERRDARRLGYITNTPLRFPNEPARHKILDIIGDISLIGRFIKGIIIAVCPGHRVNNKFARCILDDIKEKPLKMQTVF